MLVATSIGKAAAAFGASILIEYLFYRNQLEVIMTDVIRGATDRPAIRASGLLFMDYACLLVENPIHE
ncbi:hypothetical protein [Halalkalicoccus ordinarius]|uniref:hypothetical protein n=1 Tax=Halalkalicoccus ordinarius TaxID=3116651 RepID=UPI00300F37E4